MEFRFLEDHTLPEEEVHIVARHITPELMTLFHQRGPARIPCYGKEQVYLLEPKDCVRFFVEEGVTRVETKKKLYSLKMTLQEVEDFGISGFLRISKSEIINIAHVTSLDLSFSGTILCHLDTGSVCSVSRRKLKEFRRHLHL